jgi:anti-sigma B factor antagonist
VIVTIRASRCMTMLSYEFHNCVANCCWHNFEKDEPHTPMANDIAIIDSEDVNENLRIIRLLGRLDIQGVNEIDAKFAFLAASAKHRIVVDLAGLDFLASIGIRTLISNAKAQQQRGGRLVPFVGDNEPVARILETMGINTLIPMYADTAEAREAAVA